YSLCLPYAPCPPCLPYLPYPSYPPCAPYPPYARGQWPEFFFAPRSSSTPFSSPPRPCVWPLPLSFPLPAYLDCFRVSVVKSSAYRRRKLLTSQLHPTPSNRLAVIAAGGRSPQQKPVIRSGGRARNGE